MKIKLNRFEQGLMKISSCFSSDIKKAVITGEIEKKRYHSAICFAIGLPVCIIATPLTMILKSSILFALSESGLALILVGLLFKMLIVIEQWEQTKNNQSQKKSHEVISKIQEQDRIDKNELMFTKEALEKEMNDDNEIK